MKRYQIYVQRPVTLISEITVEAESIELAKSYALKLSSSQYDWQITANGNPHTIDTIEEIVTEDVA
jgi:hypothetical protein